MREADIILSVLVPSEAVPTADAVAAAIARAPRRSSSNATPLRAEPVASIERTIRGAGASIINAYGGPPRMDYSPHFEASQSRHGVEALGNFSINAKSWGLARRPGQNDVRRVPDPRARRRCGQRGIPSGRARAPPQTRLAHRVGENEHTPHQMRGIPSSTQPRRLARWRVLHDLRGRILEGARTTRRWPPTNTPRWTTSGVVPQRLHE